MHIFQWLEPVGLDARDVEPLQKEDLGAFLQAREAARSLLNPFFPTAEDQAVRVSLMESFSSPSTCACSHSPSGSSDPSPTASSDGLSAQPPCASSPLGGRGGSCKMCESGVIGARGGCASARAEAAAIEPAFMDPQVEESMRNSLGNIVDDICCLLEKVSRLAPADRKAEDGTQKLTDIFDCTEIPQISPQEWFRYQAEQTQASPACLVTALIYVDRVFARLRENAERRAEGRTDGLVRPVLLPSHSSSSSSKGGNVGGGALTSAAVGGVAPYPEIEESSIIEWPPETPEEILAALQSTMQQQMIQVQQGGPIVNPQQLCAEVQALALGLSLPPVVSPPSTGSSSLSSSSPKLMQLPALPLSVDLLSVSRLLSSALMIAARYGDDLMWGNSHYALASGQPKAWIARMESVFLQLIDWRCAVSAEEFWTYVREIERFAIASRANAATLAASPTACCLASPTAAVGVPSGADGSPVLTLQTLQALQQFICQQAQQQQKQQQSAGVAAQYPVHLLPPLCNGAAPSNANGTGGDLPRAGSWGDFQSTCAGGNSMRGVGAMSWSGTGSIGGCSPPAIAFPHQQQFAPAPTGPACCGLTSPLPLQHGASVAGFGLSPPCSTSGPWGSLSRAPNSVEVPPPPPPAVEQRPLLSAFGGGVPPPPPPPPPPAGPRPSVSSSQEQQQQRCWLSHITPTPSCSNLGGIPTGAVLPKAEPGLGGQYGRAQGQGQAAFPNNGSCGSGSRHRSMSDLPLRLPLGDDSLDHSLNAANLNLNRFLLPHSHAPHAQGVKGGMLPVNNHKQRLQAPGGGCRQ
uniref:Uncharacterized protein n=1 Tax=Chromera velia CCMP2878 TaxID=1169474 RepID=A0A0G4HY47_9ALVE|eukprot:Cvel_9416.t1-p1 / transcript=Cvel_9416.t1 / gene=Cvel_9416 / organism=Chromera_velia_CCMP2878 / gene_product=hypothetical protein / transcript_product=hypothetical protein / location=Cvel_scaffold542:23790-26773(-) / protein_length=804 / sequence_SO=supercontig / SO=protein_coding / is_pseudo=false